MLTGERLRELLHYDSESGVFTRRVACGNRKAGEVAGWIDQSEGYVRIGVDGRQYWAHRLAWLYSTGEWPPADVDHKDRNRANNRWTNLRAATRAENLQNQVAATSRSKTGERGIQWDRRRLKFRVEISVGNRNRFIGRFDELGAARQARRDAQARYHPGAIL